MSMKRYAGLLAVAGVAFAVGHLGVLSEIGAGAWAQAEESAPGMEAYITAGTPGEHHKRLNPLVGEFIGEFKIWMTPDAPPMISRGTVSREWILGGRYVKETVEATSDMGTFTGVGYTGYNNFDGQYEMVWMDSMSTGIYFETGIYDPDKKALVTRGSHRDPGSGKLILTKGTLDLSRSDEHVYAGYLIGSDGREFKHFEGVTRRK